MTEVEAARAASRLCDLLGARVAARVRRRLFEPCTPAVLDALARDVREVLVAAAELPLPRAVQATLRAAGADPSASPDGAVELRVRAADGRTLGEALHDAYLHG